jgi:hypothetical protein
MVALLIALLLPVVGREFDFHLERPGADAGCFMSAAGFRLCAPQIGLAMRN